MGYDASYKIVEELDSKFKSIFGKTSQRELNKYKNIVVGVCMLVKDLDIIGLSKLYDNISTYTRMYINCIVNNWKADLEEHLKESNEIHVCGWEFSRGRPSYSVEDIETTIDDTVERIFYIAITPTPDILDKSEDYYNKINLISDELNVEEIIYDIMEHSLFDMYAHKEGSDFSDSF